MIVGGIIYNRVSIGTGVGIGVGAAVCRRSIVGIGDACKLRTVFGP